MSSRSKTATVTSPAKMDTGRPTLALAESYEEEIAPLLTTIDQIRTRVADIDTTIDLPAIVVIGEQSSGKSSVLEALSGIPLPRGGQHMTTKCPLELRMRRGVSWYASLESSGRLVRDSIPHARDIGQYIVQEQNRLTHNRDQISKNVLSLNVQAPWLPNLTLIDLPGIIQVASKQQDSTSVETINELVGEYLDKSSTIILAIIQACNDIETSAAIKYARLYDPEGERTIGVLTKLDLVDRGAEQRLLEVFDNKRIPLKHGYLMVKCRTQEDIDNNIDLSEALRKEDQFFSKSAKFSSVAEERRGCPALARLLTRELVRNIKQAVPRLIGDLRSKIHNVEQQFRHLGIDDYTQLLLTNDAHSRQLTEKLFAAMQQFRTEISRVQEGAQVNNPLYAKRNELNEQFYKAMHACKSDESTLIQSIKTAMVATQGPEPSDYILFRVTKTVCLYYIKAIRIPMEQYLSSMLERTNHVIESVIQKVFQIRPNLLTQMRTMHENVERQLKIECQRELELMLEMEESFVYADNPLYRETLQQTKRQYKSSHNHTELSSSTTTLVHQSSRYPLSTTHAPTNSLNSVTTLKRTSGAMSEDNDDEQEDELASRVKISRPNPPGRFSSLWPSSWTNTTPRQTTPESFIFDNNARDVSSSRMGSIAALPSPSTMITTTTTNGIVDSSIDDTVIDYRIRIIAMQQLICQRIVLTFPQRVEFQLVRKQFSQLDLQSSILSSTSLEQLDTLMADDPEIARRREDLLVKRTLYDETIKQLQRIDQQQQTNSSNS